VRFVLVVSAEHASRAVPAEIDLGVGEDVLRSHTAWDPGAQEVATAIATAHGAPLFLGEHTRLVADLNRSPTNLEVVPEVAFGTPIPGNHRLDDAGRAARIAKYHRPYWQRVIDALTAAMLGHPGAPILHLSIHSFTTELHGNVRAMPAGVLFDPDRPLEAEVAAVLRASFAVHGLELAENGPYDGRADALTTACRGVFAAHRYAGVEIELSQAWLDRLDRLTRPLLEGLAKLA
jgi:predicted N-formylglutamate amidohydrolase